MARLAPALALLGQACGVGLRDPVDSGAPPAPAPTIIAATGGDGNLQVLRTIAENALLLETWQDHATGYWYPGGPVPTAFTALEAASLTASHIGSDALLQLVGTRPDTGLPELVVSQDASGGWTPGYVVGDGVTKLSFVDAHTDQTGTLQVVGLRAADGRPFAVASETAADVWQAGQPFPDSGVGYSTLTMGLDTAGTLQVFALGAADGLFYVAGILNGDGTWRPGHLLRDNRQLQLSSVSLVNAADGTLEAIALDTLGHAYGAAVDDDTTETWAGFSPLDQTTTYTTLAVAPDSLGNVRVLGVQKSDGRPRLVAWQDTSGEWHDGMAIINADVALSAITLALGNDGNLQLFGVGADDLRTYLAAWMDPAGSWNIGFLL